MSSCRSSKSPSYEGSRRPSPSSSSNGGRDSSSLEKCPKFYSAEVLTSNTIISENNLNSILSKKSSPDHFKEILSTIHENGASEEEKCQEENNFPEISSKDDDENAEKVVVDEKEKLKRSEKEIEKVKENEESVNNETIEENVYVEVIQVDQIEDESKEVEVKKEGSNNDKNDEVSEKLKDEEGDSSNEIILTSDENTLENFMVKDEIIPKHIGCIESGTVPEAKIQDDNQIIVKDDRIHPNENEQTSQLVSVEIIEENKVSETELNLVHLDQEEIQPSLVKGCEEQMNAEKAADPEKEEESSQGNPLQLESNHTEPPHLIEAPAHQVEVHQVEINETDRAGADQVIQVQVDNSVQENGQVTTVDLKPVEEVNPIQRNCQVHQEKVKEPHKDETDDCVGLDRACLFETEDSSHHDTTIESIECMPETPVLSPIVCLRRSLKLRDEKRDKNDKRVSFDPLTLLVITVNIAFSTKKN